MRLTLRRRRVDKPEMTMKWWTTTLPLLVVLLSAYNVVSFPRQPVFIAQVDDEFLLEVSGATESVILIIRMFHSAAVEFAFFSPATA